MRWYAKVWYGFKIALGIANRLQDKGVIKIKELPKINDVVTAIEETAQSRPR